MPYPYPDKETGWFRQKNGAVARGNGFSILRLLYNPILAMHYTARNAEIDNSDIQMSGCGFLSFWHAIHPADAQTILRTPEMSTWQGAVGSFCVAGVAFRDTDGAFVWQALHWVTWMVLSCGIQWEGRHWKVTWFWYLIHSLPSKSLNQHSSSLFCLLSLHFFQKTGCSDENQTITVYESTTVSSSICRIWTSFFVV